MILAETTTLFDKDSPMSFGGGQPQQQFAPPPPPPPPPMPPQMASSDIAQAQAAQRAAAAAAAGKSGFAGTIATSPQGAGSAPTTTSGGKALLGQ